MELNRIRTRKLFKWLGIVLFFVFFKHMCFNNGKQTVLIEHVEKPTTWVYDLKYPLGFEVPYYALIEGCLDDTAKLEQTYWVWGGGGGKGKKYKLIYTSVLFLPKGVFKARISGEYAGALTYKYIPYKATKGHVKFQYTRGWFPFNAVTPTKEQLEWPYLQGGGGSSTTHLEPEE